MMNATAECFLKTQKCALQGQCVPQAPSAAHGRLNFVVFALSMPVPVLPPAGQSANPCCGLCSASLGPKCGGRSPGWSGKRCC